MERNGGVVSGDEQMSAATDGLESWLSGVGTKSIRCA